MDFPGVYNVGDLGSIPGSGRSPGEGNGNPLQYSYGLSGGSEVKASACNVVVLGSIPESGRSRSPGEGKSNPLQYSCLGNLMDRGACWATVHGVAKSWTHLSTKQQQNHSTNSIPCMATVRLARTPPCIVWTAQSAHDFLKLL